MAEQAAGHQGEIAILRAETVPLASLRPHPRNYQQHPADQVAHLVESLREHGLYRPIVIARDGTILAGHGIAKAASEVGLAEVAVVRLDLDPDDIRAIKLLTADNEISHLAERDDRLLSELLKQIKDEDIAGLVGTGYDAMMLANLVMVTRPASEVGSMDEAAEWVGLPEYEPDDDALRLTVKFRNEADRLIFCQRLSLHISEATKTTWWPALGRDDTASLRVEARA